MKELLIFGIFVVGIIVFVIAKKSKKKPTNIVVKSGGVSTPVEEVEKKPKKTQ